MKNIFTERAVFYRAKLMTGADENRLTGIMKRAAKVGWNGLMLEESGCLRDFTPDGACLTRLANVKSLADDLNMKLIPCSFAQGEPRSDSVDLRECYPVRDTPFKVSGTSALPVGTVGIKNGSFDSLANWSVDLPGTMVAIDTAVKHSGASSLRITNPSQNSANGFKCRIFQLMPCLPFRAYKVSIWVKTESFSSPANIGILVIGAVNGRYLYQNRDYRLGVTAPAATQDWKQYIIDFNPLENTAVNIYITANGNATGKIWIDDVSCTEVGLFSSVRRPGCPIVVTSSDNLKIYAEGRDYVVGSERLTIPAGSTITNGQTLKVDWWQLADNYELWAIPASAAHPDFYTILEANARLINSRLNPSYWMMRFDEWRAGAWEGPLKGGPYLAEVIRKSADILKRIDPTITPLVWGDMFDEGHNARKDTLYYGFNGFLTGSWLGMPANMIAVNWWSNPLDPMASLRFWSDRGLRQWIGGYYESQVNVKRWLTALSQAEAPTADRPRGVEKVEGFMLTTWGKGADGGTGKYEELEAVMGLLKASGRVADVPPVPDPDPDPEPDPIPDPVPPVPFGMTDAEMLAKGWVRK